MTDKEAKDILRGQWAERSRLREPPVAGGWWIRARPGPAKPAAPCLKTPGAKLFKRQPDGMWLFLRDTEWADAICIEHCNGVQNLNDKRSCYMPALSSILVEMTAKWLTEPIAVQRGGHTVRWRATRSILTLDPGRGRFEIPIRHLRVLYALPKDVYARWMPNHALSGYEFFCTHDSLGSYTSQPTQRFLARMSSVANRLTRP